MYTLLLLIIKFICITLVIVIVSNTLRFIWLTLISFLVAITFNNFYINRSHYWFNYDILSTRLVLITFWLTILIILSQQQIIFKAISCKNFLFLVSALILTFSTRSLFIFYFYFELCLIPIFLNIIGWGYQPERLKASIFIFFYTLFASLPLLFLIFNVVGWSITLKLSLLQVITLKSINSIVILFILCIAFLVKFPIYSVHLWLPKAHVEAPVIGSMVLAGVLLKLGGYGIIRVRPLIISGVIVKIFLSISVLGGGLLGLICIIQRDIKVVIAYSSVVHMALVIRGVISLSIWGIEGAVIIIIAHGVCSSGMFTGANIIYERRSSRRYYFNIGYLNIIPIFSSFWFILLVANFGGPFTYNLLGEIILILNLYLLSPLAILAILLLSFFSAAYSLILYRSTQQGQLLSIVKELNQLNINENLVLVSHCWPLIMLPVFLVNTF